jgi:hypothetical protein
MQSMLRIGLLALAVAAVAVPVAAQQEGLDQEAMMQKYLAAATPGEPHALLARLAGSWRISSRSWEMPGAPATETEGTAEKTMILGGRFLQEVMHSTMMGMPFEGRGVLGYDNLRQEYSGVWLDNMGTQIMPYKGGYDPQTGVFTLTGEFVDAATGRTMAARLVTTVIGEDEHRFEMFSPGPDGEDFRWVEMIYRRQ